MTFRPPSVPFRRIAFIALVALTPFLAPTVHAARSKPAALMEEHKCFICHGQREAKAGPSLVEIAARYRDKPDALATLSVKVTRGAHGDLWNMPPHPEVTRAEARAMARYILSRK